METCKYHPLVPTSFHCDVCEQSTCATCVDDTSAHGDPHCIRCGGYLESVANSDNVAPFWRRIEDAFKYPVNSEALMMIIGVSVGMAVVSSLPFGGLTLLIITLALYGAMLNYSFMAMTTSSEGDFEPPTAIDALVGGLGLSFKMILMIILMVVLLFLTAIQLGSLAVNLLAILFVVGLPAILITFAHSGSILQALNPLMFVTLMFRVGFPYLVLLGFIMVMSSSVALISSIIGNDFAAVSTVLQSIVTNYYTVVMFHLMGYMLYQYQDRLGFSSTNNISGYDNQRSAQDNLTARINALLKEGEYARCLDLLKEGATNFPDEKQFSEKYFDLLLMLKQSKALTTFAETYFMRLAKAQQLDRLYSQYRRLAFVVPKFKPQSSELRYRLAQSCDQQGDFKAVYLMINGLHVDDLKYVNIVPAYELLVSALKELNQSTAVNKCALLVDKLKAIAPAPAPKPESEVGAETRLTGKAVFGTQNVKVVQEAVAGRHSSPVPVEAAEDNTNDLPPIEFKL
ncbi:B-box zinc finger protein [Reinekea sp.]|jgi:tetratricopeptide (TPR) repeat protein|uniref:B-box zinc finger protein n=1 Tax=Reinekea sp. TaxID=1970455 RepID=UPI0039897408